jgi:hypothetical protein
MRRFVVLAGLAVTAALAAGAAAGAGPPHNGCPTADWSLEPLSVLGSDFSGVADNVNHDGWICIKDLPSGIGGVFIDNTAP